MTGLARVTSADPIVTPGTIIQLYDSYGTTGGGEFNGQIVGTTAAFDFISFCLETNEYFSPGQNLLVDDVSNEARAGGSGGPHPDPISYGTAYLFTQFSLETLSDYAFGSTGSDRVTDANSLQRAIWYFEQELGTVDTLAELAALDFQAYQWVNEATAAAWTDIGNVRVLNLLRKDSSGNYTVKAQDQLYYQSVPEPGSWVLLAIGLAALCGVRARAIGHARIAHATVRHRHLSTVRQTSAESHRVL